LLRLARRIALLAVGAAAASVPAAAQNAGDRARPSVGADGRPCLSFAFGTWTPPLDWQSAGHRGDAEESGAAARRLRDSIFLQKSGDAGAGRDGMMWDEQSGGTRLVLFPWWWPAGVLVRFDSSSLAGDTLRGTAEAMVADAGQKNPTATVRALRRGCSSR
jgi:hypothetical protein